MLKPQVILCTEPNIQPGVQRVSVGDFVRQTSTSLLALISRALHANFDRVAGEPLPERWVDLINHLNECEKAEQAPNQNERPLPTRRPVH